VPDPSETKTLAFLSRKVNTTQTRLMIAIAARDAVPAAAKAYTDALSDYRASLFSTTFIPRRSRAA
jgi:hypothetical protein